jgi:hypothetical protein
MPLADTLLCMAEMPRLYIPKWSDHIMEEVSRNLIGKRGLTPESAQYREDEMRKAFPDSWITGYELLIPVMNNQEEDRHVLAAAVRSKSEVIVTYNKRHFPQSALDPWGIECKAPSKFLQNLYDLAPAIATRKLNEQAENIHIPFDDFLVKLRVAAPGFVDYFCEEQGIELSN